METIDDTQKPIPTGSAAPQTISTGVNSIKNYLIKLTITLVLIIGAVKVLLPDLSELKKAEKNEALKLFIVSLVQNPRTLWKLSELEESRQKYDAAIAYMDAAIGLLELHNAGANTLNRYQTRLQLLQDQSKGR